MTLTLSVYVPEHQWVMRGVVMHVAVHHAVSDVSIDVSYVAVLLLYAFNRVVLLSCSLPCCPVRCCPVRPCHLHLPSVVLVTLRFVSL